MLEFGSGSGTRGCDSSKPGRDERKNAITNPNASINSSAGLSEYDEDDEVERAERNAWSKGNGKRDTGKRQDTDKEDAHKWIIMDFCDDNGVRITLFFTGHSTLLFPMTIP
jgi:hypothetical protein